MFIEAVNMLLVDITVCLWTSSNMRSIRIYCKVDLCDHWKVAPFCGISDVRVFELLFANREAEWIANGDIENSIIKW